jgi:hypothetical protein
MSIGSCAATVVHIFAVARPIDRPQNFIASDILN